MRTRPYLSPSQIKKWESEPEAYFIDYLADTKVTRSPQTMPMAVGSSFDAYVKASLQRRFGLGWDSFPFESEEDALSRNIENPIMLPEASAIGKNMLVAYKDSGAYGHLCEEVLDGGDPTSIRMEVDGKIKLWGIPFVYKPDFQFTSSLKTLGGDVLPAIIDWKVNGYCSKTNVSPNPGFINVVDGWKGPPKSRGNMMPHKNAVIAGLGKRLRVNSCSDYYLPSGSCDDWSIQLGIYALGACQSYGITVDDTPILVGIDQLACKTITRPGRMESERLPRVAQHRWLCTPEIVRTLRDRVEHMWEVIHSDHIFRWMSKDESRRRCDELNKQAALGSAHYLFSR